MARRAFRSIILAAASVCAPALTAWAAPAPTAALNQARVAGYYHDGEFDKVIKELEGALKSGRSFSHADSVFLEKYLAVVYAANPGTRELGRYHMFRLLDLSPASDLLDMFVGDEVGSVFDKVHKEHDLRKAPVPAERKPQATAAVPAPSSASKPVIALRPAPAPKSSWDDLSRSAPSALASGSVRPFTTSATTSAPSAAPAAANVSARAQAPAPTVAARTAWTETPARAPAANRTAPAGVTPALPKRVAWDDLGSASALSAGTAARPSASVRPLPSAAAPFDETENRRLPSEDAPVDSAVASRPAWKEPGLWIGAGAALTVAVLTFMHSGSQDAPPAKTYVVPSTASH